MAAFSWDSSYSVKVGCCDDEHKKLFQLVSELHDAMREGKGSQVVQRVVDRLADYTKRHFAAEEALMLRTNYPMFASHKLEHQKLMDRVGKFKEELKNGTVGQSVEVAAFLNDWLAHHIKETDQRYSAHLNANGVH